MRSEHSFKIDLEGEENFKPLPYTIKKPKKNHRVTLPDIYPKFEVEFFDVAQSCAEYIDKIADTKLRLKYHNELNKIFILRHKGSVMRLFIELAELRLRQ